MRNNEYPPRRYAGSLMNAQPTIAILYPGELGAALAAPLRSRGYRVVTTLGRRSDATARRAHDAGLQVLQSMGEVVRHSDVVISLVPPAAAEDLAQAWCDHAHLAPPAAIYADMNSIGPELARTIEEKVARTGHAYIDAAVNGLAKNLTTGGTLFLSGDRAAEVAALFTDGVRTKVLGNQVGQAKLMKMLLSGLSKGVCALFAELALVARNQDMLVEFDTAATQIYPGIMTLVDRMLPTYAQHAARRATETREVEETAHSAGVEPRVLAAVRELHERLADASFADAAYTVESLVEHLAATRVLGAESPAVHETRKHD